MAAILFVLSSNDHIGTSGIRSGNWLDEFATPYYRVARAGHEVTVASPAGGSVPVDHRSSQRSSQTDAVRRYTVMPETQELLHGTLPLADVDAEQYDGAYYAGAHVMLTDVLDDPHSIALVEHLYAHGKPFAAVGHGPGALLAARRPDGVPVVTGREVTSLSHSEEASLGLDAVVPRLVEDELVAAGARYTRAEDWCPHVAVDGPLVTGQNPASLAGLADAFVEQLALSV